MEKTTVKMTIEQLEKMLEYAKNRTQHGNMMPCFEISIGKHPNGEPFIEFEQPCHYHDCNSIYHRY